MNTITVEQVKKQIEEIEKTRDQFLLQANAQMGTFNFAIQQLRTLIGEEKEPEPDPEFSDDGKVEEESPQVVDG